MVLEEGQTFNGASFIFDSDTLTSAVAEDFCILLALSKADYLETSAQHPEMRSHIKLGLKSVKSEQKKALLESLSKIPFFEDFTTEEIAILYQEHMELIFLKPGTLVTAPSTSCNALYFILKGSIDRYCKSAASYEAVKLKVLGDDIVNNDDYDSFVQQVDLIEKRKAVEESKIEKKLEMGDWMGSKLKLPIRSAFT